jgi:hypothetical protein
MPIDNMICGTIEKPDNRTKYRHSPITRADGTIDHYCYMQMISMDNSAIDHAIKKLTHAGKRGEKSRVQDWKEAIMSIESAIEIEEKNA